MNIQIAIKVQKTPEVWTLKMEIWQNVIIYTVFVLIFSTTLMNKCMLKTHDLAKLFHFFSKKSKSWSGKGFVISVGLFHATNFMYEVTWNIMCSERISLG